MMPGMTGLELAQEVRRISPDTQVVLMTAHDTVGLRDTVEDMRLGGYVGKPFSVPQIQRMVERHRQIAARLRGDPDPEIPLDVVPEGKRRVHQDFLLKNSFGFGGCNSCLVLRRRS